MIERVKSVETAPLLINSEVAALRVAVHEEITTVV